MIAKPSNNNQVIKFCSLLSSENVTVLFGIFGCILDDLIRSIAPEE